MPSKFCQLLVPNYDDSAGAAVTSGAPLSYMRLGAHYPEPSEYGTTADFNTAVANEAVLPADTGNELLKDANGDLAVTFKDDGRYAESRVRPGHRSATSTGSKTYYYWNGTDASETTTDPRTFTAKLLTRGGYREHTDGNKISTTRGDCLEVVGGNYKLIVMGRVEGAKVGTSYWESSGGHNHDSTSTPGEVTTISWSENEDGTWRVFEETYRGNVISYYQGTQEDHFFGPSQESLVTRGTNTDNNFDAAYPIVEEETWANSVTSETNASGNIDDTTTIRTGGSSTEYTWSAEIEDFTGKWNDNVMTAKSKTYANNIDNRLEFQDRHSHALGMIDVAVSMAASYERNSGTRFGLDGSLASAEIAVGAKGELDLGVKFSFTFGLVLNAKASLELEIDLGVLMLAAAINSCIGVAKGSVGLAHLGARGYRATVAALKSDN